MFYNIKNIEAPHYELLAMEIQRWPGDSPHNGTVIRKAISFHDVIIRWLQYISQLILSGECTSLQF